MSVQKTENEIEDEAYKVVEATNDDGTINAEVTETPTRKGDKLVIKARPLIPNVGVQEFRLKWPEKNSPKFDAVRLARNTVGGFQAISQLKNERIKIDKEDGTDWSIVIPENKEKDLEWLKGYLRSKLAISLELVVGILFLSSIVGVLTTVGLAFLYPFGVSLLTFGQGMSVFFASLILLFITGIAIDGMTED